jgi:hypothetical protein
MPLTAPQTEQPANLAQRILLGVIRLYQLVLSPVFGTQCRFYPSCSHYASDAILSHGACKGLVLGAARILRCNPCCEGGHDPVPDHVSPLVKLKS